MSALEEPFEHPPLLQAVEMPDQDGLGDMSEPEFFQTTLAVVKQARGIYQTARDADTYRDWVESYRLDNPVQYELVNEVIDAHKEAKPMDEIEATIAALFAGNLADIFITARKAHLKNQRLGLHSLSLQANTLSRTWFDREYSTPKRAALSPRYPVQILCSDFLLPKLQKAKPPKISKPPKAAVTEDDKPQTDEVYAPETEIPHSDEVVVPMSERVISSQQQLREAQDYLRSLHGTADHEDPAVLTEFSQINQHISEYVNRSNPERIALVAAAAALEEAPEFFVDAACKGRTEFFFGPAGERPERRSRRERIAKALCAACPVIDSCLNHALMLKIEHGIWGGWNEEERGFLTPAQRRKQAAAASQLP
jgi:WhiB family redox-sensing transcriptional regulator